MTVLFAPEAESDFRQLIDYIHARNPIAAAKLADRIFAVIDQLAGGAFDGPEQTLATGEIVRSWPVPPIRIYYQRRSASLWIIRLYHQARPAI